MSERAWLDVSVFRCPNCGWFYVDASWYVVELEADIECGRCHQTFNAKKHLTDRVMLEFEIETEGKVAKARVKGHIPKE